MPVAVVRIITGFLAGALAVAIFQQGMQFALIKYGLPFDNPPWNMAPNAGAFGLPSLLNLMFWGGLWGIAFAFAYNALPGGQGWLKGFIFATAFTLILGSWLVVSLIKGRPIFAGIFTNTGTPRTVGVTLYDSVLRMRTGFLLVGVGFGIGLGLLYSVMTHFFGRGAATRA